MGADPAPISAGEPYAERFSMKKAEGSIRASADAWFASRRCVSCHTNGLALLAAPAGSEFRRELQSQTRGYLESLLEESGRGRARTSEGLVATAALLAISESPEGRLSAVTRRGLDEAWRRQGESGHWPDWLKCNWPPFESDDHFGATLMAVAMGEAPAEYRETPAARQGVSRLERYLASNPPGTAHQQAMTLWASSTPRPLVAAEAVARYPDALASLQNEDGGWNLPSLGRPIRGSPPQPEWRRTDGKPQDFATSDGYATGFVAYVLQRTGADRQRRAVQRAKAWLEKNQRASGRWFTRSPRRDTRHYIANAGTSLAVLALTVPCDPPAER